MSKGNVDKFLELMQTDEGLARKMAACLYMLENGGGESEGSGGFIEREIVPLAKEYGFEFTEQDFLDYTNEATAKAGLRAEDLAEVSGRKSGVRAALMGTLALLGVTAAPAAVEMISGGEVAPFSMVASAADKDKVKILKGRADAVLANVEHALQRGTVEDITVEIKNVQEFLQFLETKNIDDRELTQKKDELEKKKAELEQKAAEKLTQDLKAKIDNVETELRNVIPETKTELETKLEEALSQAKSKYEALAAALEGDDAEKSSAALKDARTQYEAFTGAIKTYLEGLKKEVEEALKTEADESRPYLVKIIDELKKDTSDYKSINEQLKTGSLTWIQYIRIDIANIKTVKASYDKLDELNMLIDEQKDQFGEDNQIIVDAEEQERQLREKLDLITNTASLEQGCVEQAEKAINELKVSAAEKAKVELAEAKKNAEESMKQLAQAIASANGYGGQALEDAIKLKNDLDTELKGSDANAINDTVAKIDETIEALNKAKLEELPNSAPVVLKRLNDKLNELENMRKMQNRTDEQKTINDLRNRIEKFGKVTNENATEKEKELKSIRPLAKLYKINFEGVIFT